MKALGVVRPTLVERRSKISTLKIHRSKGLQRPWVPQWPKTKRMMSDTFLFLLTLMVLSGVMVIGTAFAVAASRFNGEAKGYNEGFTDGHSDTCAILATQVRWTFNVEDSLVASGKASAAAATSVKEAASSAYQYTCVTTGAVVNLYFPGATTPPVPLGAVTLPVSAHPTGCAACLSKRGK